MDIFKYVDKDKLLLDLLERKILNLCYKEFNNYISSKTEIDLEFAMEFHFEDNNIVWMGDYFTSNENLIQHVKFYYHIKGLKLEERVKSSGDYLDEIEQKYMDEFYGSGY
ncbi:MAG: hypothetical protein ACRCW9_04025 [Cetobacterium sp.]